LLCHISIKAVIVIIHLLLSDLISIIIDSLKMTIMLHGH
jgi:hypothetical protein